MELITSKHNPMIKYFQKLKKRRFREQEKKFLVEGFRFVEEAVKAGSILESIIYSPEFLNSGRGKQVIFAVDEQAVKKIFVAKNIIDSLASTDSPQGVLAVCRMKEWNIDKLFLNKNSFIVLVDGVTDPGNLGTIIRSADAFGADGAILMSGTVDIYNDKALRATMGSIFHLPVFQNISLEDLPKQLHSGEIELLVGDPREGRPLDSIEVKRPVMLVVGSEATGPSEGILSLPHKKVTIPMPGKAESLNAAVAASIMLYQIAVFRKIKC